MKTKTVLALALTLGLAPAGLALASDAKGSESVMIKDQETSRSTIVAIDKAQRTVTLKGPEGKTMELIVDDAVTRFDALKVGDIVSGWIPESAKFEIGRQAPGAPTASPAAAADQRRETPGRRRTRLSGPSPSPRSMPRPPR
jgi:hypothetical protein